MFEFLFVIVLMAALSVVAYLFIKRGDEVVESVKKNTGAYGGMLVTGIFASVNINFDLAPFWDGFNQFFNALNGPILFISSISAALGFIFLIATALRNAFNRGI